MTKMEERKKMVVAMEYIARQINNEEVFEGWLMSGIADGDIKYGDMDIANIDDDDYYMRDDNFKELMTTFLIMMKGAWRSGGLYCGGVVSKDKGDYVS